MFERIRERVKGFFPQEVDKPRDWELGVLNSYKILAYQIQLAEEAKLTSNFMAEEHAGRVKTRIGNFKDIVLELAQTEHSIMAKPQYMEIESGEVAYFYYPKENTLGHARYQGVRTPSGAVLYPASDVKSDIDETTWCLDKNLVTNLAVNLIGLLPPKSSRRILTQAAYA